MGLMAGLLVTMLAANAGWLVLCAPAYMDAVGSISRPIFFSCGPFSKELSRHRGGQARFCPALNHCCIFLPLD